ncbi:hypothetical protein PQR71_16040 [Paraburkholderia fungorum]|uniref:hypothetical protein n=1 Tax=Paraburkholderia fungorum TaxID=134537 RepID=UPI0038B909B1
MKVLFLRSLTLLFFGMCMIDAAAEQRFDWGRIERLVPSWPIVTVGDEIPQDLIDYWKTPAVSFFCPGLAGQYDPFPSKRSNTDKFNCDHLDTTLFAGLLCGAGLEEGCRAVMQAQNRLTGMWFRSPKNRWYNATARCPQPQKNDGPAEYCEECVNTFSPDMGLGAMLYIIKKGDDNALRTWYRGIERVGDYTKLCEQGGSCSPFPWPRLCADDQVCVARNIDGTIDENNSKRPKAVNGLTSGMCILKPVVDSTDYDLMADVTHMSEGPLLKKERIDGEALLIALSGITPAPATLAPSEFDQISAELSTTAFPLHLEATRVFLRMVINNPDLSMNVLPSLPPINVMETMPGSTMTSLSPPLLHQRAVTISARQSWNPFYKLLADGPTPEVRSIIIDLCPAKGEALGDNRTAWLRRWESDKPEERSRDHSMGWDCVFVGMLFNKMRVQTDYRNQLISLFTRYQDPLKILLSALQAQVVSLQQLNDAAVATESMAHAALNSARALAAPGVQQRENALRAQKQRDANQLVALNNQINAYVRRLPQDPPACPAVPVPDPVVPLKIDHVPDAACVATRTSIVSANNIQRNAVNQLINTVNAQITQITADSNQIDDLIRRTDQAVIDINNKVSETAEAQALDQTKRFGDQLSLANAKLEAVQSNYDHIDQYLAVWSSK